MPEKPATVAAYAAAASLAAVTFFYVISPNYALDHDGNPDDPEHESTGAALFSRNGKKHTIVGLVNRANDCFLNSVLQALAPLYDLRLYLVRELHRREADGRDIYERILVPPEEGSGSADVGGSGSKRAARLLSLQRAPVTEALKLMLDALNERPIYRKTITADNFLYALERAFGVYINRNQQDAQEFLQIVTERLWEEYLAGERVRKEAKRLGLLPRRREGTRQEPSGIQNETTPEKEIENARGEDDGSVQVASQVQDQSQMETSPETPIDNDIDIDVDVEPTGPSAIPFPFRGQLESQVQCRTCGYKPKPKTTTFVNLTLQIPQHKGSATLGACFDTLLVTENIDDYRCDKCALLYVLSQRQTELTRTATPSTRQHLQSDIDAIQHALATDPEHAPEHLDLSAAPKRRIARHTRITEYPRVLAVHLSRSIYGAGYSTSAKNATKVQFPEVLKLGRTILSPESERRYRLVSIVCHKGSSHDSGHYESFRRCVVREPVGTKVNEKVWRWVGNRSRSTAVSRAASTACSNGESNARNGSVAEGTLNGQGQGQQQVRQTGDDAGFAASKSPSSLSFQIDESPRNELNGASSTRTPSIATASASASASASQAPTTTAETTPRSSPSLVSREENISSPSQSQSQAQDTSTQQQQQPPPPPEQPEKPERPSRLRRTTSKGAATLQSLRSSGSEEKKKKKKKAAAAAAGKEKSKTHSDRWFRVSDEKVKNCKTADVLGMQKEVYLLFYELEEGGEK